MLDLGNEISWDMQEFLTYDTSSKECSGTFGVYLEEGGMKTSENVVAFFLAKVGEDPHYEEKSIPQTESSAMSRGEASCCSLVG